MSVTATEDLSGTFTIPITYEATGHLTTGATDVKDISGTISVTVDAESRIRYSFRKFWQHTSAMMVTGQRVMDAVTFVDADIDGSEYLDYILIDVPDMVILYYRSP
ncbi:hypothetical protein OH492_10515 [Vibrio chagasii]|nr:hypothetical protein [Vibrio chagasii]